MKESLKCEILAAVLALTGAFTLVVAFFPVINPGMSSVQGVDRSFVECLPYSAIPILILSFGIILNRKAQKLKRDGK